MHGFTLLSKLNHMHCWDRCGSPVLHMRFSKGMNADPHQTVVFLELAIGFDRRREKTFLFFFHQITRTPAASRPCPSFVVRFTHLYLDLCDFVRRLHSVDVHALSFAHLFSNLCDSIHQSAIRAPPFALCRPLLQICATLMLIFFRFPHLFLV